MKEIADLLHLPERTEAFTNSRSWSTWALRRAPSWCDMSMSMEC